MNTYIEDNTGYLIWPVQKTKSLIGIIMAVLTYIKSDYFNKIFFIDYNQKLTENQIVDEI